MHVLVFHGYLLRGTGSNVYNARLVPALAAAGHTVDLLAQDADAEQLDWVDVVGTVRPSGAQAADGSVTVWQPDLNGLLPVYVRDRYPGFEVKTFVECSDAEIEAYVAANAAAIAAVAARRRPDVALIGHLVMGPVAAVRGLPAGVPYAVKVHGSDLEYAVAADPSRFVAWAQEGIAGAATLLVGSGHTARRMFELLDDPGLAERTRLGPPGVDTAMFHPRPLPQAQAEVRATAQRLQAGRVEHDGTFARDEPSIGRALEAVDLTTGPWVAYVGKLLRNKGVDLLAAAWPLVLSAVPGARLMVVGFGDWAAAFDRLVEALAEGEVDEVRALCDEHDLSLLRSFLETGGVDSTYLAAAATMTSSTVARTGRLEHDELAPLLSACSAQVVPSTFPEAFGMVAAEAAAAGVMPVVADHSGLAEVAATLAPGLPSGARGLLTFALTEDAVVQLADRLVAWLNLSAAEQDVVRASLVETAGRTFGWDGVAAGVVAAAQGRHNALAPLP